MDPALIGVGGTLGGTALGSGLTWLISRNSAREEREHQEDELIRQRREASAVALSAELERLDETLPKPATPSEEAMRLIGEAAGLLRRCEKRAAMIEDADITARLRALNYGIWTANDEAEEKGEQGLGQGVNIWSIGAALADLYQAVDAYQLRKVSPNPAFPSLDELIELVGGEPGGMQRINKAVRLRRIAARKDPPSE
jgi:chromosome condensin MukBEF ATPase and DNA-binding subunit MukB